LLLYLSVKLKLTPTEIKHKALLKSLKKKSTKKNFVKNKVHGKYKNYDEFLKSSYWKSVRKAILERDENKCRSCSSMVKLHVHHDTYIHHLNELNHLSDLRTLCEKCHNDYHKRKLNKKRFPV